MSDPQSDPLKKYQRGVVPLRRAAPASAPEREKERGHGATLAVLVCFLVVLIGGGVWLMSTLRDMSRLQDCAMQGRRNCAPIEVPARER